MLITNFTHRMTNLTMITADKWAGMAFTLLLLIHTDVGYEILNEAGACGEEDIVIEKDNWPKDGKPGEVDDEDLFDETNNNISNSTNPLTHSITNTK
jgi:hypothetical protein